jgi:tetratricopeptide (TPR) repeat protein
MVFSRKGQPMSEITKQLLAIEVDKATVQVGKQFFPLSSQAMAFIGRLAWAFQEQPGTEIEADDVAPLPGFELVSRENLGTRVRSIVRDQKLTFVKSPEDGATKYWYLDSDQIETVTFDATDEYVEQWLRLENVDPHELASLAELSCLIEEGRIGEALADLKAHTWSSIAQPRAALLEVEAYVGLQDGDQAQKAMNAIDSKFLNQTRYGSGVLLLEAKIAWLRRKPHDVRTSLRLLKQGGRLEPHLKAQSQMMLGLLASEELDYRKAIRVHQNALEWFGLARRSYGLSTCLVNLGLAHSHFALQTKRLEAVNEAVIWLEKALATSNRLGIVFPHAQAELALARIAKTTNPAKTELLLETICQRLDLPINDRADALTELGDLKWIHNPTRASVLFREALSLPVEPDYLHALYLRIGGRDQT